VILTGGEAYFEVVKNKSMPFIVVLPATPGTSASSERRGTEIEVLGTHFDVMAYTEEKAIKATLLEGSIKVKSGGASSQVLIPGQQAQVVSGGALQIVSDPDAEETISWINGNFQFNKDDITAVMRQLARWYDVEVEYEGKKTTHSFSGVISRDNNASDVLKALEVSDVHFRIEGRRIIVLP
jgi:ferric-dicitrate binding protein FerR (iron transport regulator)